MRELSNVTFERARVPSGTGASYAQHRLRSAADVQITSRPGIQTRHPHRHADLASYPAPPEGPCFAGEPCETRRPLRDEPAADTPEHPLRCPRTPHAEPHATFEPKPRSTRESRETRGPLRANLSRAPPERPRQHPRTPIPTALLAGPRSCRTKPGRTALPPEPDLAEPDLAEPDLAEPNPLPVPIRLAEPNALAIPNALAVPNAGPYRNPWSEWTRRAGSAFAARRGPCATITKYCDICVLAVFDAATASEPDRTGYLSEITVKSGIS